MDFPCSTVTQELKLSIYFQSVTLTIIVTTIRCCDIIGDKKRANIQMKVKHRAWKKCHCRQPHIVVTWQYYPVLCWFSNTLWSFLAVSTRWCTKSSVQQLSISPWSAMTTVQPLPWSSAPSPQQHTLRRRLRIEREREKLCVYVCAHMSTFAFESADSVHVHLWIAAHRDTTVLHRKPQEAEFWRYRYKHAKWQTRFFFFVSKPVPYGLYAVNRKFTGTQPLG